MDSVLVIKMSSLGDIVHTFPALTDAQKKYPNIKFDWVVESPFKDLPRLHPAVDRVIVNPRIENKKKRFSVASVKRFLQFKTQVQASKYDAVIEAQYTNKGAKVAKMAQGKTFGLSSDTAHDPGVAKHFDQSFYVSRSLHAIERTRKLFALSLGYDYQSMKLEYGLNLENIDISAIKLEESPYLVFCHLTTWATKHAPRSLWISLLNYAKQAGYQVLLPWVGETERVQTELIIKESGWGVMFETLSIIQWARLIESSHGVIGVDTGLTHLGAALNKPTLSIFGPTNPVLTGVKGVNAQNSAIQLACSPCMSRACHYTGERNHACMKQVNPAEVWQKFTKMQENKF